MKRRPQLPHHRPHRRPHPAARVEEGVRGARDQAPGPGRAGPHGAEAEGNRVTVEAEMSGGGKVTAICRGTFVAVQPGHPAYHRW